MKEITDLCKQALLEKNLANDKRYEKRLKWELEEISAKEKSSYFLDLFNRKVKYPYNQNNLLVVWLLNIAPDFNLEQEPKCTYGDFPDIDTDYISIVRQYLKEDWAPREFGKEYVCNISSYGTFGIKQSLKDMARVHGLSHEEIEKITTGLPDKDEEGERITWDSAMRLYPELKKYCEENPDVAKAAHRLLNRNRQMGVHAGGLIIASGPLSDFVPLVKRKDDPQASAWVEGLHGKDLQPVGLVKFDLLVIANLLQLARCCRLVKERHNIEYICARPGLPDWSDVPAWRNNPRSLEMANRADLKCIFQFDSEGIRKLVRAGGVDRFEDLPVYNALYRPGPLGCFFVQSKIKIRTGEKTVLELKNWHDEIAYINKKSEISYTKKFAIWKTGKKKMLKITTKSGKSIMVSYDHRILSENSKFKRADNLKLGEKIAIV